MRLSDLLRWVWRQFFGLPCESVSDGTECRRRLGHAGPHEGLDWRFLRSRSWPRTREDTLGHMAKKKHERDASKSELLCAIVQHLSAAGFSAEEIAGLVAYSPPLTAAQIATIVAGPDYRHFAPRQLN
jgi:hypothetical protein